MQAGYTCAAFEPSECFIFLARDGASAFCHASNKRFFGNLSNGKTRTSIQSDLGSRNMHAHVSEPFLLHDSTPAK